MITDNTAQQDDSGAPHGSGQSFPIPEQHLNAYIDGELAAAKRRALERVMAADAALRARVAELIRIQTLVRLAYDPNLDE